MVNYLDSRRIAGTTAERSSIPSSASYGGWVELGRTTLGSAGDTITVSGLADKRYYMVLAHKINSGASQITPRLGNGSVDTGSNYAVRWSRNGAADTAQTSQTSMGGTQSGNFPDFSVWYITNRSANEKLLMLQQVLQNTAGAGTAPQRTELVGKWANTSNPLDVIHSVNFDSGDYAANTELVVLGWDPSDTHSTNFWEELADVNASASSTSINTGTFTAKKYLWIQAYVNATGADITGINATVNSDTGTNYAVRVSNNGNADGTILSNDGLVLFAGGNLPQNEGGFVNMFVINNSANEKLFTGIGMKSNTAGAANAPSRREFAQKWVTTGSQITSFQINRVTGTGTFDTSSFIKVWGSD